MKFPTLFRRRSKAVGVAAPSSMFAFGPGSGWSTLISRESFAGSWQRNQVLSRDALLNQSHVFAALSLISGDVSKCRPRLMQLTGNVWGETTNSAYSSTLSRPNGYQSSIRFLESWVLSKLVHGNFYGLKVRDNRNVVSAIYPLDPFRVEPLVATDNSGSIFYRLSPDHLTGIGETITVPAREIIHDRWHTIYHPLVGVSPLIAAAAPATLAHHAELSASKFYQNGAQLSGVLSGPGSIDPDTAKRLEDKWNAEFQGSGNAGALAVLGSGLEFKPLSVSLAADAITNAIKWSGQEVATIFHIPAYKLGLMDQPRAINNIEALQTEYLTQALQTLIEAIEYELTAALSLGAGLRVQLDVDALLRMDSATQAEFWGNLVAKGIAAPNEARAAFGLPPVAGGATPYLQQQNFGLAALAARDAAGPAPATAPAPGA